jgi:hypothetical protein
MIPVQAFALENNMVYVGADPGGIAAQIGRDVSCRPLGTDGAARAASLLAALV